MDGHKIYYEKQNYIFKMVVNNLREIDYDFYFNENNIETRKYLTLTQIFFRFLSPNKGFS